MLLGVVFIGSGLIDAIVNYAQTRLLMPHEQSLFISISFYTAAIAGCTILLIDFIRGNRQMDFRDVLGGVALGIPNYLSIYFMVKALSSGTLQSSVMFPIANMGVVTLSTISGYFLFKEKISKINLIGIALSLIAIVLIAL